MTIWLRSETRKHERRTPLIPAHAAALIALGFKVTVEASGYRVYPDHEYAAAGCQIAPAGNWRYAPQGNYILGIKELPVAAHALSHKHIYYADAFERQHMAGLLARFRAGGGVIYDYEYMTDNQGQQVVSMSHWAGYCGAAIALLMHKGKKSLPEYFKNRQELDAQLSWHISKWKQLPRALVIGASGVAGKGVLGILQKFKIPAHQWHKNDTCAQDSAQQILDFDLVFNCVALKDKTRPFLTNESFVGNRNRTLIVDISCFLDSIFGNPFPFYDQVTSFANPIQPVTPTVDLIAIDNLPSFLPKESSNSFSTMLFPHLLQLLLCPNVENTPWKNAETRYYRAIEEQNLCALPRKSLSL